MYPLDARRKNCTHAEGEGREEVRELVCVWICVRVCVCVCVCVSVSVTHDEMDMLLRTKPASQWHGLTNTLSLSNPSPPPALSAHLDVCAVQRNGLEGILDSVIETVQLNAGSSPVVVVHATRAIQG